jgi:hypothetical protein
VSYKALIVAVVLPPMVTALGFGKPTDKDMFTPEKKNPLKGHRLVRRFL